MPWTVERGHGCPAARPWAVIKQDTGGKVACHPTEASAEAHRAALYANEPGLEKAMQPTVVTIDLRKALQDEGGNLPNEVVAALREACDAGYSFADVVEFLGDSGYEMRIIGLQGEPDAVLDRMIGAEPPEEELQPVMVALFPDTDTAGALAHPDMPAEEIHCTLVYLGKMAVKPELMKTVMNAVESACMDRPALRGTMNAVGQFMHDDPCYVALPDVPGLTEMREAVRMELAACGLTSPSQHDWMPHMTMTRDMSQPPNFTPGRPVSYDHVMACFGKVRMAFPLQLPDMLNEPEEAMKPDGMMGPEDVQNGNPTMTDVHVGDAGRMHKPIPAPGLRKETISTRAWGQFTQADYSLDQWKRACIVDRGSGSTDTKQRYAVPVREPSGTLNRGGIHAAAGAHGLQGVKGVPRERMRTAARKLVQLYRDQLDTDAPPAILEMAGMNPMAKAAGPPWPTVVVPPSLTEGASVGQVTYGWGAPTGPNAPALTYASGYRAAAHPTARAAYDTRLTVKAADGMARDVPERRFTLSPWYIPNAEDAHGEWTDPDTLQQAAWGYVDSEDRAIRLQHNREVCAGRLVEIVSWPFEVTCTMTVPGGQDQEVTLPPGTVYCGVLWEPWAWQMVRDGRILGMSIGGNAMLVDLPIDDAA